MKVEGRKRVIRQMYIDLNTSPIINTNRSYLSTVIFRVITLMIEAVQSHECQTISTKLHGVTKHNTVIDGKTILRVCSENFNV